MNMVDKSEPMPVEDRRKMILRLLDDTSLALPPKVIYLNLKDQGAPFGERTVNNHLSYLLKNDLVERPEWKDDYYRITDEGRAYLKEPDTE